MRITKYQREAFVRAVLSDTPKVDYLELKRKVIQDHLLAIAPPDVLKVYKNHKEYLDTAYVKWDHQYSGWGIGKFYLVPDDDANTYMIKDEDVLAVLRNYDELERQQAEDRSELETKLKGVIAGFTTVRKAREAMPEFAKYLPEDDIVPTKYLPAIDGLVTDLVKMGWAGVSHAS